MKPFYRTYELAKKWDCSTRTILRMLDDKELPGVKIRGTWRIPGRAVDEILEKTGDKSDKSDKSDKNSR